MDIPALNALIKERGLCARSSHTAPEPRSNASLRMDTDDQQQVREQLTLTIHSSQMMVYSSQPHTGLEYKIIMRNEAITERYLTNEGGMEIGSADQPNEGSGYKEGAAPKSLVGSPASGSQ